MVQLSPIDEMVHCTVRIECHDEAGNIKSGTGSFFQFEKQDQNNIIVCVITNRHVMEGAVTASFNLTESTDANTPIIGTHNKITIRTPQELCIYHPDPNIDLVAIMAGGILNRELRNGRQFFVRAISRSFTADTELLSSLSTMSEIAMIGYPIGLWDEYHNLPLIRRGITSTHPNRWLNNKPEFMIDAACFPGSSGSPVFLANLNGYTDANGSNRFGTRFFFLGCLWGGPVLQQDGEIIDLPIPTKMTKVARLDIPTNLGYVINATKVWELEKTVIDFANSMSTSRNSKCSCGSGNRYKSCCGVI